MTMFVGDLPPLTTIVPSETISNTYHESPGRGPTPDLFHAQGFRHVFGRVQEEIMRPCRGVSFRCEVFDHQNPPKKSTVKWGLTIFKPEQKNKKQTKVGLWDGVVSDSHLVMIAQFI